MVERSSEVNLEVKVEERVGEVVNGLVETIAKGEMG